MAGLVRGSEAPQCYIFIKSGLSDMDRHALGLAHQPVPENVRDGTDSRDSLAHLHNMQRSCVCYKIVRFFRRGGDLPVAPI